MPARPSPARSTPASARCSSWPRWPCSAATRSRTSPIALLVGLVVGTYSSVFVATPLLTYFQQKAPMSRVKKEKVVRTPEDSGAVV